ncbi:putative RNA-directed DNA polymerase [Helianthus annuus]|nr:putative RNA-directed DNA polymerase [Helianthus annuus]
MSSHIIHPAVTVNNIKNSIPLVLDQQTNHYNTWAELFKNHCKAYEVYDHLQPRKTDTDSSTSSDKQAAPTPPKPTYSESWERIDAIVLQWIYGTITQDLLHTIMKNDTTAYTAWTTLRNIFLDNQESRTIDLQNKFANTRLDQFPNMSAYCQAMKLMFDQLSSLGSTLTEKQLVMQILTGLNDQYENIALILQQTAPLPDFYNTRSRLCQVEERKTAQAKTSAQAAGTALTATPDTSNRANTENRDRSRHENYDRNRGRGRGRGRRGRGSFGRGRFNNSEPHYHYWNSSWAGPTTPWNQWAPVPPCPYPSAQSQQHSGPSPAQGILGPRPNSTGSGPGNPAHSYNTGYSPTDIAQALYNLALHNNDSSWTMDTGATGPPDQETYPTVQ